uniref:Uncharacterized protein n=1 Tax=Cucumis melo TaxID=3656 RepID=A0A9I9EKU2_CUCME
VYTEKEKRKEKEERKGKEDTKIGNEVGGWYLGRWKARSTYNCQLSVASRLHIFFPHSISALFFFTPFSSILTKLFSLMFLFATGVSKNVLYCSEFSLANFRLGFDHEQCERYVLVRGSISVTYLSTRQSNRCQFVETERYFNQAVDRWRVKIVQRILVKVGVNVSFNREL